MDFPLDIGSWGIFFAISFAAAAVNSVAGGGTFLTFPVFILNGLTALQANIMSTLALWPGTLASVWGYRDVIDTDRRKLIPFLITGVIGGVIGALLLLWTPEVTFKKLVPWLMLVATIIFVGGSRITRALGKLRAYLPAKAARIDLGIAMQLAIAIYGGYFGAGIGILTLAMLQLLGYTDIHKMNGLKTVLTASINAVTAFIFLAFGPVIWPLLVPMVGGAVAGGYVGARLALRVPPHYVRLIACLIAISMTAYFFIHGA